MSKLTVEWWTLTNMLFRNFTPFPPLQFESRDEQQRDFGVVVVRGTFKITPNKPLSLEPEQEPLVMADVVNLENRVFG